jgi:hypothetical protein
MYRRAVHRIVTIYYNAERLESRWYLMQIPFPSRSRVSSGSIVSDYGLDDRAIGVRSPAGAKDFSSILGVQTGSGAHPASCTMGTGGPFPGGKAGPGGVAVPSTPYSGVVGYLLVLFPLSPQAPPWRVAGLLYLYLSHLSTRLWHFIHRFIRVYSM